MHYAALAAVFGALLATFAGAHQAHHDERAVNHFSSVPVSLPSVSTIKSVPVDVCSYVSNFNTVPGRTFTVTVTASVSAKPSSSIDPISPRKRDEWHPHGGYVARQAASSPSTVTTTTTTTVTRTVATSTVTSTSTVVNTTTARATSVSTSTSTVTTRPALRTATTTSTGTRFVTRTTVVPGTSTVTLTSTTTVAPAPTV